MKYLEGAIIGISCGLWLINFFNYKNDIYLYRVAKGFGLNLRIWTMFLYYSMCRTLLNGKFERHVEIHKLIGYIVTFCSIGHSICHIVNTGFISNTLYNSGYFLFLSSFFMFVTFLLKKYNFSLFKFVHLLYYPWLIVSIIHMYELIYWFLVPLIIFSIDTLHNFNKLQISKINNVEIIDDKMIYLPVPRKIDSVPGAYYYICIPSCGYEWHPYSVASSSLLNQLLFLIEIKGDWTTKVYNLLKHKKYSEYNILVMGPYLTSSVDILKNDNKNKLCVCSGIGITPFLSVIDTKIDSVLVNREYRDIHKKIFNVDFEQIRAKKLIQIQLRKYCVIREFNFNEQQLKVIWIFRDLDNVNNFFTYIKEIMRDSRNVELEIYITSKSYTDEMKIEFIEKHNCNRINIIFGRPNFKEILDDENIRYDSVYYCGNPQLKDSLIESCQEFKINFYSEMFS